MEQTFYVNVLFGKNKSRIFQELAKIITTGNDYHFQIHPFRISPVAELSGSKSLQMIRNDIKQHTTIMEDINSSNINSVSKPFKNTIFVNYSTRELEPAIKFNRICFFLCDYIDESNIEVLTMTSPIYINFMKKAPNLTILNTHFMNYSILTFYDTNADSRIADKTSLDIGEETDDDVTFILQTRLQMSHITDDDAANIKSGIILPYHPFSYSLFLSTQNVKDNINAVIMSRDKHLIYYPFDQTEWLVILRNIMYEHVILNFLVSENLYNREKVTIHRKIYRNNVSFDYKYFKRVQRKHKTHVLNETVFNYKQAFINNSHIAANWYNRETKYINIAQSPQFALDILCLTTTNGIFI